MTLLRIRRAVSEAGLAGKWVTRDQVDNLGAEKGAYVLALELPHPVALDIAKFSNCTVTPGWHVYMGSARGPGGLRARLRRHLSKAKKMHWHIDRLTVVAEKSAALAVENGNECELFAALLHRPEFNLQLPGFGSTDCQRCASHLLNLAKHRHKKTAPKVGAVETVVGTG